MEKYCVLSLSGGMDSSSLLLHLLSKGYKVQCLSFDYGQKHKVELEKAKELVEYINSKHVQTADGSGIYNNFIPVSHQIIHLNGLGSLLNSSLVEGGEDVPEGHYEQENMKDTVVPNRNKIFSSIIQAVALSISQRTDSPCQIALGLHAGDHFIYKDCRQEFRDADYNAFLEGNEDGDSVTYYTPYLKIDKFGILQDGEICCKQLGLDFDEVYSRTMTSYKPIFIQSKETEQEVKMLSSYNPYYGSWYSDYKSASSVERIEAFIKLGRPDPAKYANIEEGPVDWEVAKSHVINVLENYSPTVTFSPTPTN